MTKKAKVGQLIEWTNKKYNITLRGIVLKENTNSVIAVIENLSYYSGFEIPDATVINHKNYSILKH